MEKESNSSFAGLRPASAKSSRAARGASAKTNNRCELTLRRELSLRGLRYRLHHAGLPGRPDIVLLKHRIALFCDGDFWHGRDVDVRFAKLARGHNAMYWIAKLQRNVERDRRQTRALEESGWLVLRFWETDVLRRTGEIADTVVATLKQRSTGPSSGRAPRHANSSSSSPSSSEARDG